MRKFAFVFGLSLLIGPLVASELWACWFHHRCRHHLGVAPAGFTAAGYSAPATYGVAPASAFFTTPMAAQVAPMPAFGAYAAGFHAVPPTVQFQPPTFPQQPAFAACQSTADTQAISSLLGPLLLRHFLDMLRDAPRPIEHDRCCEELKALIRELKGSQETPGDWETPDFERDQARPTSYHPVSTILPSNVERERPYLSELDELIVRLETMHKEMGLSP